MGNNIALFGTSADPPTIGHEEILGQLSKIYILKQYIGFYKRNFAFFKYLFGC